MMYSILNLVLLLDNLYVVYVVHGALQMQPHPPPPGR